MGDQIARRRVTTADIARAVGVSRSTVGYVLNNTPGQSISEATRKRVLEEAARQEYRPHTAAQALASGRSRIILLVLPDWPISFTMRRYVEEASLALDRAGYTLVTHTRHATGQGRPLWESLSPDVVIGFVPFHTEELASLRASGVTKIFPDAAPSLDWRHLATGPRLQVEHLHELGHQRLGFATWAEQRVAVLAEERVLEAQRTAERLELPPLDVRSVDYHDGSAAEAVRAWHDAGVTAVAAHNDDTAAMVVGAALRAGLSVPADLAVIGHDDTPLATMFVPSLSSIRVDGAALGRYFAVQALAVAEDRPLPPAHPTVDLAVVPRESTRPEP